MTSRQRVLSALARTGYDRIPVKHYGEPEINALLRRHFGLADDEQLRQVLGDDFRYVAPVYRGPELRKFPDGTIEGYWGERYMFAAFDGGEYRESAYRPFEHVRTLAELDRAHFPTADWFDFSTLKAQCEAFGGQYAIIFGSPGDGDFMNSIAKVRGVEQVLRDLAREDPVYLALMQARFEFYYELHKRAFAAAPGLIDIIHVGEDLGTQRGPMISMKTFEKHFVPKYAAFFELAHRNGAKTMMHMCGCVEKFLSRLIEIGLDVQDVVQPTTPEMDVAALQARYGERLNFCGTMCVQTVLPFGTAADVEREVQRRLALFPKGGLILGPTHAIQVRTPLENILALYRTAGGLRL